MELEHHPDYQPCPPDESYVKEFKSCPVCHKKGPTREHVAKHFLDKIMKDVVDGFADPLSCSQCDYQSEKTSETVALHIALNHDAIKPYVNDKIVVEMKRSGLTQFAWNDSRICNF